MRGTSNRSSRIALTSSDRLLVGIDESRKQIACGLVDTIGMLICSFVGLSILTSMPGSYTFAKTLEYKAKQGLHSGKEVTVIPPNEYQERFINAMDNYFVACPGTSSLCTCARFLTQLPRQMVAAARRHEDPRRLQAAPKRALILFLLMP